MQKSIQVIPMVKLSASSAVCYNRYEYVSAKKILNPVSKENLTRGRYNGILSKQQQKRISMLVTQMHLAHNSDKAAVSINHKMKLRPLSFVTLTLAGEQKHTDNEVKKLLLDKFIIYMKRSGYFKHYLWKAEKQKNGRIHFHIVTPEFIDKMVISLTWNKIQKDAGYTDQYFALHGHHQPPSTKIEASRDVNQTGYYIAKYMAKNEECLPVGGRIWGCSDSLRNIKECTEVADNVTQETLDKCVETGALRPLVMEHCTIYRGDIMNVLHNFLPNLKRAYINNIFRNWALMENSEVIPLLNQNNKLALQPAFKPVQSQLWQTNQVTRRKETRKERTFRLLQDLQKLN